MIDIVPGNLPAPVIPFCSKASISSMSRSAARMSGSISARNASTSSGLMLSYVGASGRMPDKAKDGVKRCEFWSSSYQKNKDG